MFGFIHLPSGVFGSPARARPAKATAASEATRTGERTGAREPRRRRGCRWSWLIIGLLFVPRPRRTFKGLAAAHACSAQATVAVRVFGQVLLVVVLGVVEGHARADLGGDGSVARLGELFLVRGARCLGGLPLRVVFDVDGRAVLGAETVALTHALRRVVALPERAQQ